MANCIAERRFSRPYRVTPPERGVVGSFSTSSPSSLALFYVFINSAQCAGWVGEWAYLLVSHSLIVPDGRGHISPKASLLDDISAMYYQEHGSQQYPTSLPTSPTSTRPTPPQRLLQAGV
jgi:hypothetical protein